MATDEAGALSSSGAAELPAASGEGGAGSDGEQDHRDLAVQLLDVLKQDGVAVDSGKLKVDELVNQRKELQKERKRLTAALRNENRKRQRIRKRSQYLSNEDLVDVLAMRKCKMNATEMKDKAKSSGDQDAPKKGRPSKPSIQATTH